MNPLLTQWCDAQATGSSSRGRLSRENWCSPLSWPFLFVFLLSFLSLNTGCSSVQSSVEAIVTGETPPEATYAGRQHFPVTPREAVEYLVDIAPHEGWKVVSTGAEYSTHGAEGAFFRLEPLQPSSDKKILSGIFYAEPSGSYVRVSEQQGLPESLVKPLIAAIKKKMHD